MELTKNDLIGLIQYTSGEMKEDLIDITEQDAESILNEYLKAINYKHCSYKLSDKLPQSFEDWRKENCKQLASNLFDFKGNVYDGYDLRYVYMREVKHDA